MGFVLLMWITGFSNQIICQQPINSEVHAQLAYRKNYWNYSGFTYSVKKGDPWQLSFLWHLDLDWEPYLHIKGLHPYDEKVLPEGTFKATYTKSEYGKETLIHQPVLKEFHKNRLSAKQKDTLSEELLIQFPVPQELIQSLQ